MLRTSRRFARAVLVLFACIALPPGAQADAGGDGWPAHHLSVTGGYARYVNDVRPGYYSPAGAEPTTTTLADFDDAREFGVRYRHTLRPGAEVYAAFERMQVSGTDFVVGMGGTFPVRLRHRTDLFGTGYRTSDAAGSVRPFLEMGFVYAREWSGDDESLGKDGSSFGIATATGAEFAVARALSIPFELGLRFAMPIEGVTTLAIRSGLTWHLGHAGTDAAPPVPPVPAVPELRASDAPTPPRFHISLQVGIGGHVGRIEPEYRSYPTARGGGNSTQGSLAGTSLGFFDLAAGSSAGLAFRQSIRPGTDFVFDLGRANSRRVERSDWGYASAYREFRYTTWSYGLGVRKGGTSGGIRPFAQAGVALMYTVVRYPSPGSGRIAGLAANFATGVETMVSRTVSVPIEGRALISFEGGDQIHLGIRTGLKYGFGAAL